MYFLAVRRTRRGGGGWGGEGSEVQAGGGR